MPQGRPLGENTLRVLKVLQQRPTFVGELSQFTGKNPGTFQSALRALASACLVEESRETVEEREARLHLSKGRRRVVWRLTAEGRRVADELFPPSG